MKTTQEKHNELKKLGKKNRGALYEMIKLATEIIDDPEYCDQYGGQGALIDHLEATDFAHFGGKPKLANMIRAYQKNPEKGVWDECQHNICAMIALAAPVKQGATKKRIKWEVVAKELEVKVEMLELELKTLRAKHDEALQKIGRLSRVSELV